MIGGWRRRRRDEVRPRLGGVRRADGTEVPVVFQQLDDDPHIFQAMDLDGEPICLWPGDKMYADIVGPGQGIVVDTAPPPPA